MDASRTETCLRYGKTSAFLAQQIAERHAHVLKTQFAVTLVINIAHHWQIAHDGEARSIARHQHHTLLAVSVGIFGVSLAHDDEDFAAFAGRAGNPPLTSVQHVLVTLAANRELDVSGIR